MRVAGRMLMVLATLVLAACTAEPQGLPGFAGAGYGGIVVSEDSIATEIGVGILRDGGNAVDAAIATAFALAVTHPLAGNLGGGGFMVVRDPRTSELWSLDFREVAPGAATPDMYDRLADAGQEDASTVGPLSAAIPGTPAGLYAAWNRAGSWQWGDLLLTATALARDGFAVSKHLADNLEEKKEDLAEFETTTRIFFRDGEPLRAGERLVQPDLANVLTKLAFFGPETFYRGDVAGQLIRSVRSAGGIWTLDDLKHYEAVFREPVRIRLSENPDAELVTMSPPASGGLAFGQALAFLRAQQALQMPYDSPARAAAMAEALRLAFADRNTRLADPARMNVSLDELLDPEYLEVRAELLPGLPPGDSERINGGMPRIESTNTTHIVVMDERGGVVSLTTTLNANFGSKWVAPGTGILLNDQMDDFDTRPGRPNLYGLVGSGVNAVAPGARMLSSMSPTIVLRDGEPWFALGARGGPRIISSLLQVILYRSVDGMNLIDAVATPRVHHQWWPDEIFLEETRQVPSMRASLEAMGYAVGTKPNIGRVMAAERLPDGSYLGVRDPRVPGLARAVRAGPDEP